MGGQGYFLPPVASQSSSSYSSATSRNQRAYKYETLGSERPSEKAGHTQKISILSIETQMQDDGTPAFGKKTKSVVNDQNMMEFCETQRNMMTDQEEASQEERVSKEGDQEEGLELT